MTRVAVIGAGPSGITAAKQSIQEDYDVTVFEQEIDLGGNWLFSPDPSAQSGLYEEMITNMPKQLMEYEDCPYPDNVPSFMTGEQVLEYLRKYSEGIRIKFGTRVVKVEENKDEEETKWKILIENSKGQATEFFDIVFVCNGHCREPTNYIDFSAYKGKVIHSHDYRRPSDYRQQTVAIIGTGLSGIDIALQLAEVCEKVHLVGNKEWRNLPGNVCFHTGHVKKCSSHALVLSSDQEVSDFDTVIDCTGYRFNFSFLDKNLVQITHDGKVVNPVWRLVAHMLHPSDFFFIGLNELSLTFLLYEQQAKFALSLASGRIIPPSVEEMQKWTDERYRHLEEENLPLSTFHLMPLDQYDYMTEMAELGGYTVKKNLKLIRELNEWAEAERQQNPTGYKKKNISVVGEDFTIY